MAGSLALQNKSSTELTKVQEKIVDLLADGQPVGKIAMALAKGDKAEARRWRHRIRKWAYTNPKFQQGIAGAAKGTLILATPQVSEAVVKRASRGRVDAAKLVFEASGFHNPRVQHEHSGEVKISLAMPRPEPRTIEQGQVVDAEVVED